jgi:hypothetical protein
MTTAGDSGSMKAKKRPSYDVQKAPASEYFIVLEDGEEVARHDTKGAAWDDMGRRIRAAQGDWK